MDIIDIYEEYTQLNKEYIEFVEKFIASDLKGYNPKAAMMKLIYAKSKFEELKIKSDELQVEEKDVDNLKDLKYLIMDSLFLSVDLIDFYKLKAIERFKMRAVNYINKRRRAEIFQR